MQILRVAVVTAAVALGGLRAHAETMVVFALPAVAPAASVSTLKAGAEDVGLDELSLGSFTPGSTTPAAVTPEPSSVLLLGTGLLSMLMSVVRKRSEARHAVAVVQRSSDESAFARRPGAVART